jgi:hypothetical protein
VLRKPLNHFKEKYGLKYCIIGTNYVPGDILGLKEPIASFGNYSVFKL